MQINYDFPWYIQQAPAFMTLYTGLFEIAEQVSPLPFLDMLDLDHATTFTQINTASDFYGIPNVLSSSKDALIYNMREWSPRPEGETEYYWNGSVTEDALRAAGNYIKAKAQIRGQPLSLATLKQFYETALDGYNYSVANNISVEETLQHFEIVVQGTQEVIEILIEMSATDRFPFGKPVGISYNITYVLP